MPSESHSSVQWCSRILRCLLLFGALSAVSVQAQTYIWNSGDILPVLNPPTVLAGATLDISTTANHDFNGSAIVNQGTVNWLAGDLRSGGGGSVTNNSLWNDQSVNQQINNAFGGGGATFTNSGTYAKSGAGTTTFYIPFYNSGLLDVQAGTFTLLAGGTLQTGATVNVASSALLLFDGNYSIASGVTLSGPGTFQLGTGTLSVAGNLTAPVFVQTGGLLAGTPIITGGFDWQSGDWSSGGITTVGAAGVLNISTTANHDFNGTAIVNQGTVNWLAGDLRSGGGGTITNSGVWSDETANQQFNNAFGGGGATFTNSGTYAKSGAGTTTFLIPFTNSGTGTVIVDTGTVSFSSFTNSNGSVFLSGGGTINLPGAFTLGTGTLGGTGTVSAPGGVTSGGLIAPVNLVITGGGLVLQSTAILALNIGGPVAGTDYGLIAISGSGVLDGQISLVFSNGFNTSISPTDTFTVLTAGSALTGAFTNVANGGRLFSSDGLGSFQVNYGASSAFAPNAIVLSGFQAVPEPSTWALLSGGLLLVVLRVRRCVAGIRPSAC